MEEGTKGGQPPQQALEPVLQEEVPFRDHTITAVKLADGRYAVVLRWVCEALNLDPSGQVQRIQRTATIAGELLRVRVQPRARAEKPRRGGGAQIMPVLTLRGFSPWILGINPGEVEEDPGNPAQAEHIREMIRAYQQEAIDVLYSHFMQRAESHSHPALPLPSSSSVASIIPVQPSAPPPNATHAELATYHAAMALWHRWQADHHAEEWRGEIDTWRGSVEARLESEKELLSLIPEVLERLGPEKLSTEHQTTIRGMVKRLSDLTGTPYQTIYWELAQAFQAPRYEELLESQYPAVFEWFRKRIEAAKQRKGRA
ncbi:phage antirepressor N-terminal domain-containing protein [Ktedonobacter racemifer]|nr:phage antirepressor N-terminal domain-containing protein [Ktedonobacter racemifer]